MKAHCGFCLLAAAALAVTLAGGEARAAYTYSTELVITGFTGGGTATNTPGVGATFLSTGGTLVGLQDILTPGNFLVPGALSANIGNVAVGTAAPNPDNFTINYTDTITITNPTPGGATGVFQIKGTMTLSGVQNVGGSTSGQVHNMYSAPFVVGPITITSPAQFTMLFGTGNQDDLFAPPTITPISNINTNGSLGGVILATVPEPTSFALIGIGLTGLVGYHWRRRQAARRDG